MNQETMEKMKQMKLFGMLRAFQSSMKAGIPEITADELVAHLIDTEFDERYNRKLDRLMKQAEFRYKASFPEIDFQHPRELDKNKLMRLSDSSWVSGSQNVLLTGPTGAGKSYLACAIGYQCCIQGWKVRYFNFGKLFTHLKHCKADGSYLKEMAKLEKTDVLIIDDFGLQPFDAFSRLTLLELLEDRYRKSPVVIASQLPVGKWHEVICDKTLADAICDRLLHNSFRFDLKGESIRKKYAVELDQSDPLLLN